MSFNTISEYAKFNLGNLATTGAPSATALYSTPFDMKGYDGILFVSVVHTIAAVTTGHYFSIPMVGASSASMAECASSFAAGSSTLSSTDDNGLVVLDVRNPAERWVGCSLQKDSTNVMSVSTIAIRYTAENYPNTQDAEVLDSAIAVTPTV